MPESATELCGTCGLSLAPLNTLLCIKRQCPDCKKDTYIYDQDLKTSGLRISEGDNVHVNQAALFRLLRLRGGATFTRAGLDLFARNLFMPSSDVARNPKETVVPLIRAWASEAEGILRGSALLSGLDIGNDDDSAEAVERLKDRTELPEFWALIVGIMELQLQESIGAGDAIGAAGAAVTIASARAMLKFKTDLEDVVWRGHSVEKLRTALRIWQDNQKNDSEEFWQNTLRAHSFILSQVFATPVVVIGSKAYVGGKTIDNTGGNLADFLLQNGLTAAAAIVELKTPTTQLLRKEYRNGVYPPSAELTGAVAQVGAYVSSLAEETTLRLQSEPRLEHARSEAVVIAGTASDELKDKDHRRSFELYRSELRTVRVVTYDEMFQRVQVLLTLFGG